jgi:hypothetical protein
MSIITIRRAQCRSHQSLVVLFSQHHAAAGGSFLRGHGLLLPGVGHFGTSISSCGLEPTRSAAGAAMCFGPNGMHPKRNAISHTGSPLRSSYRTYNPHPDAGRLRGSWGFSGAGRCAASGYCSSLSLPSPVCASRNREGTEGISKRGLRQIRLGREMKSEVKTERERD